MSFLGAIASPSTYPCQSVSEGVSGSVGDSFRLAMRRFRKHLPVIPLLLVTLGSLLEHIPTNPCFLGVETMGAEEKRIWPPEAEQQQLIRDLHCSRRFDSSTDVKEN